MASDTLLTYIRCHSKSRKDENDTYCLSNSLPHWSQLNSLNFCWTVCTCTFKSNPFAKFLPHWLQLFFIFSWTAAMCSYNPKFCVNVLNLNWIVFFFMNSLYVEGFSKIFATFITFEFKVFFMNNLYVYFQITSPTKIFAI